LYVGYLKLDQRAFTTCVDSGHGGQTKDLDGDEADGFDEGFSQISHATFLFTGSAFAVIYPVDFKKAGHIVDDVS
jgi:metacaspase-1